MTRAVKRTVQLKLLILAVCLPLLSACAAQSMSKTQSPLLIRDTIVAEGQRALTIPQISACTDEAGPTLIDASRPLTLIVHGCYSSAGRFKALSEVFAFHGQQALCFNYDDRDSLKRSSSELLRAIQELGREAGIKDLTLIGHSQGGLIARRALIRERSDAYEDDVPAIQLVTVSAPFAGIRAAAHCGSTLLGWLSLGLTAPICQIATGSKWAEIPPTSSFIRQPGSFIANVRRHVKVVTDERGACRRRNDNGVCAESDYVFSLEEQYQPQVDAYPRMHAIEVAAGHVEIVGDSHVAPHKLIALLQQQDILARTPSEYAWAWQTTLNRLYDLPIEAKR